MGDSSLPTGEKRIQIRTSCPDSANAETYRPIAEIVETAVRDSAFLNPAGKPQSVPEGQDKLKVIEAEARETDKALKQILEKLGV